MRNRELMINKLDNLEGFMKTLRSFIQRGDTVENFLTFISRSEDTIDEIKSMVEREDMSPNELNKY